MRLASMFTLLLAVALVGCAESDNVQANAGDGNDNDDIPKIFESPADTSASSDVAANPEADFDRTNSVLTVADVAAEIELEQVTLLDDKVTLMMPVLMEPMSEEHVNAKYGGIHKPDLAFTHEATTTINLTMTHTDERRTPGQLYEHRQLYQSTLKQSAVFRNAEWLRNEDVTVDGRPCFIMEFRHHLSDQEVYNQVLGVSLDGRLMMLTFNFPARVENLWVNKGREILLTADFHDAAERAAAEDQTQPAE